jgi:glutamyl-Q tRNA(Asp) synthetase
VASFLHARQAGGEWLVRIEDIDPPREAPGAADNILQTLEAFGLAWDRSVLYQSQHLERYAQTVEQLLEAGLAFRCSCSRSEIRAAADSHSRRYPGTCRSNPPQGREFAVRVRVEVGRESFVDGLQGPIRTDLAATTGDYVVFRRDGLPAYHLAVVLDDALQGVTTVVRGADLLDSTATHLHLQRTLGLSSPAYFHTPVVVNALGQKLSKQTGAEPVSARHVSAAACAMLALLGLDVPVEMQGEAPGVLWQWAQQPWQIDVLRARREIAAPR